MSMLTRYRKKGGFEQLLMLVETCSIAKREQLLKVIELEDPNWSQLIQMKMLTVEKVFSWDINHVSDVTSQIVPRTLAVLLHGLPKEYHDKTVAMMTPIKKRELESYFSEMSPTPGEIEAARIKLISKVRELEDAGTLNLAQFDPSVSIREVKVA